MYRKTILLGSMLLLALAGGSGSAQEATDLNTASDLIVIGPVRGIERRDTGLTLKIAVFNVEKGTGVKPGHLIVADFRYPPKGEPTGLFLPKRLDLGQWVCAFLKQRKDGKYDIICVDSHELEKATDAPKTLPDRWTLVSMSDKDGGTTTQVIFFTEKGWVIRGEQLCFPGARDVFFYKLDPSQSWIDTDGCKATRLRGIYRLERDTLTICFGPAGGERPTDFTAPAGSDRVLLVLKK